MAQTAFGANQVSFCIRLADAGICSKLKKVRSFADDLIQQVKQRKRSGIHNRKVNKP
jgi:hypothetical protein